MFWKKNNSILTCLCAHCKRWIFFKLNDFHTAMLWIRSFAFFSFSLLPDLNLVAGVYWRALLFPKYLHKKKKKYGEWILASEVFSYVLRVSRYLSSKMCNQSSLSFEIVFEFIKGFIICLLSVHSLLYIPCCHTGWVMCKRIIWIEVEQFLIGLKGKISLEDLMWYSCGLHDKQLTFKLLFQLSYEDIKTKSFLDGAKPVSQ